MSGHGVRRLATFLLASGEPDPAFPAQIADCRAADRQWEILARPILCRSAARLPEECRQAPRYCFAHRREQDQTRVSGRACCTFLVRNQPTPFFDTAVADQESSSRRRILCSIS